VTSPMDHDLPGAKPGPHHAGAGASRGSACPARRRRDPGACADGAERPYLSLDAAASTAALGPVLARVEEFLPWYSSIHCGAGYKSQVATCAYEDARSAALAFAGKSSGSGRAGSDLVIICRNTTGALNHLAYRGINTTGDDIQRLLAAVARIACGNPPPVPYQQDPRTGDFRPCGDAAGLGRPDSHRAPCSPG